MSDWRIQRHYGYGVAGLELAPTPPPLRARRPLSPGEALGELRRKGGRGVLVELLPGLAAGGVLVLALLATLLLPALDSNPVEMVAFEVPPPPPEPELAPEPEPAPPAQVEAPIEVAEALVSEPPLRAVPAPASPVVAKPRSARPAAREPKPPPAAPRVEPVAAPVMPAEAPRRWARAAPEASLPASRRAAPRLAIEPVATSRAPAVPAPSRTASRTTPRAVTGEPRSAAPRFDLAAPVAGVPSSHARVAPSARAAARPGPEPARSASRSRELRRAVLQAPAARAPAEARPSQPRRIARSSPQPSRQRQRGPEPERLAAVPLSALSACVSDREEDALKLEVVGAVGGARQCASAAGRYRFVETKNLNAFLMRIERTPTRRATDRCIELRLALECLRARRSGGPEQG